MFTRRQTIITASGALAAATLPASASPCLYNETKGAIVRDIALDEAWDQDIAWTAGNHPYGHVFAFSCEGDPVYNRNIIAKGFVGYRTIEPGELQTALFNGLAEYHPIPTQPYVIPAFYGLRDHYTTLDRHTARSAHNVIDAGDRGDMLSSIWLVCWHENTIAMACDRPLHPAGNKAALVIRDWRYAVRIANVDLLKAAADPQHVSHLMSRALYRVPSNQGHIKPAYYVPSAVLGSWELNHYRPTRSHSGVPVRGVEALNWTEHQVI